jgi:BirA family transcriptional regulator, biotin operon repressor / biotin---[acetyl-CoA-carboxylase] ligase
VLIDERVRAGLAASTRFSDIRFLEETDSTNRVVAELAAAGAPEGLVVATDLQTAGRGRLDRTWEARTGMALLVSVLLRPVGLDRARWHLLTVATGLAARRACQEVAGFLPDLKWPNDLLVGDRKLAGILAESVGAGPAVVVGMGLNVHDAPPGASFVDEAAGHRVARAALLVRWLTHLDGLLGRWDDVAGLYREQCATIGQRVRVQQGSSDLVGRAEGVDGDGRLLVRLDGGSGGAAGGDRGRVVAVAAGDVIHLRPADGPERPDAAW